MMLGVLLLILLTSCVCAALEVNVTQASYQAEENSDVTLEWRFTSKADSPPTDLSIFCDLVTHPKAPVLYEVRGGAEVPESQDEEFAGRVQIDRDALRGGRIRLHVSRLRTGDSGQYLCDVKTEDGHGIGRCHLNVTAAADRAQAQRPPESPGPESQERTGLYIGLGAAEAAAAAAAALLIVSVAVWFVFRQKRDREIHQRLCKTSVPTEFT